MAIDPVDAVDSPNTGIAKFDASDLELFGRIDDLEAAAAPLAVRNVVRVDADVSNATSTGMDTGLEFEAEAGVYTKFYAQIFYHHEDADASAGFGLSGPGTPASPFDWFAAWVQYPATSGSWVFSNHTAYDAFGFTGNSPGAPWNFVCMIDGFIKPPTTGLLKVRFRPWVADVATPVIVKAGSSLEWW